MKRLVAAAVALVMLFMFVGAAAAEVQQYEYPEKYLWFVENKPFWWNPGLTAYDHHIAMGMGGARDGRGWNMDAYVNSVIGQTTVQNLKPFILYDEMSLETLAYWESFGVKKELFDANDPLRKWSLFTPLSMYEEENKDKVYPVIWNLHGNNNVIDLAETYGYVELAGTEEFIVICPWADNNGIILEEFQRIWAYVSENYPVDASRMYSSGFSAGGSATQNLVQNFPAMFAAIAPSANFTRDASNDAQWAALEKAGMPIVCIAGMFDTGVPINTQAKIDVTQHWMKVNGVAERAITLEDTILRTRYADQAIAVTGLPFDKTSVERHDDTNWYVGEFVNADGLTVIRLAAVEGMPHWPSGYWATFNWNFLKHWSRDLQTGALIYTE